MKIHDITHLMNEDIAVWPGDTKFERNESMFIKSGDSCNVSSMKLSMHVGTHVDSHYHYHENGASVDKHYLENYIGECQVIHVMHAEGKYIQPSDIKVPITEKRVILRTKETSNANVWDSNFKALSTELIEFFNDQGVILVGTDAPSVDLFDSKDLSTHNVFYKYDIYNIESLKLDDIKEGTYELIALPLKIEGSDGSPVRAVLLERK